MSERSAERGARSAQRAARSVASRKSGVAERSGERELQKNDGAKRNAEQEVGERQWSGEQGFLQKLVGARSEFFVAHMIWTRVYGVLFFMYGTLGAHSSSRICCGVLSASVQ